MQADSENNNGIRAELLDLIKYTSHLKRSYQSLYDGLPDLLRTISPDGIILDCNKAYAEHLGYSKEELIGTSLFDTVAEESFEAMRNSFESWKSAGKVKNREVWFKRKDGTKFLGLVSANTLYDEEGKIIGSNTVIRDITDIHQTIRKLEELKEKNLEKDQFINTITSDLKSSAIQIMNFLRTLTPQNLGTQNSDLLAKLEEVKSRSRSIVKILSDTYDFHKIENNELHLYKSQYNLSRLVDDAISKLKDDADSHGSRFTIELQENVSCVFDKNRIEQVLIQIITNAINFSPKGSGKIHIRLRFENEYAEIVVKDNGIGIQQNKLDRIFEKFHRIEAPILREYEGAGLGLYICKVIVEGHNGKIWAESKGPGTGTEIHVLLPLFAQNRDEIRKIE